MSEILQTIQKHIIQEKDDGENEFYLFDSLSSYSKYCDPYFLMENHVPTKHPGNSYQEHINLGDSWTFGPDRERFAYLDRIDKWNPYEDVIAEIEKQKSQFLSDPRIQEAFKRLTMYRRNKKFTIDDGELVIERVMAGDPEYWQQNVRKPIKKGIRILLNFTQLASQSYTTFAKNTIDMFKIAYTFELMGIPTQILAGRVSEDQTANRRFCGVMFLLKSETEQINLRKSALVACPGMMRYHAFAGGVLLYKNRINGGYGRTAPVSDKFKELAECDFLIGQENKADKVIDELLKLVK